MICANKICCHLTLKKFWCDTVHLSLCTSSPTPRPTPPAQGTVGKCRGCAQSESGSFNMHDDTYAKSNNEEAAGSFDTVDSNQYSVSTNNIILLSCLIIFCIISDWNICIFYSLSSSSSY